MEAADSTASALHGRDAQVNILHKNKRKFTRQREHQFQEFQPCYRCGKNTHMPNNADSSLLFATNAEKGAT